jgi:sucrose-6-phosphate hydrolase SacC (GH32 family)
MWLEGQGFGNVQLILDKASVEIFINNGRFSMTNIYFPTEPFSKIAIESNKPQTIYKVGAQELCSIYKKAPR